MATFPAIHYVRTGDGVDIAYWRRGSGSVLLHAPNVQLGHARAEWSVEGMSRWYEALARSFTVVRYDHRGGGLSSRGGGDQSIGALVSDIEAVADECSPNSFALVGWLAGGVPAIAYAARHADRMSHLILWCSAAENASLGRAPRLRSLFGLAASDWELFTESIAQAALGWVDADEARRWAVVAREATTQSEFLAYLETRRAWDVNEALPKITVPTLVLHDASNALANERNSRELAEQIPGARFVVCGSGGGAPSDTVVEEIRTFVGSTRVERPHDAGLTPRELEVLSLVVDGATNPEIAERLFISVNTVTRHLTHIYAKTGTSNRAQAVRYALEGGLAVS